MGNDDRRRGAAAAIAATCALLASPAPAQAQPANGGAVEEVVVTAQRREQSVQDVGIAISTLSGRDLVTRGVSDVNALQYQTPSLEIVPAFGGGQPQFRLRGVGFDDYASNNTSPVGVYADEVALPFPIMTQGQLFDLQRVEVLRGPQGTLYGRNTTGGAINLISNAPTKTFSAGVTGEYGSYDAGKVEGFVSGPVADTLRMRLSGVYEGGGAFQKNRDTGERLGDLDRYTVRGELDWDASDRLNVFVKVWGGQDKSDGQGLYLFDPITAPGGGAVSPDISDPRDAGSDRTGWGGSTTFAGLTGLSPTQKPFRDNNTFGVEGRLTYDLHGAELVDIAAYQGLDRRELEDWDGTRYAYAGVYFDSRARVVSNELRLASDGKSRLKWVGGVYVSNEGLHDDYISDFTDALGVVASTTYGQNAKTEAVFGQAEYQATARLNLIAGLRVEHEDRELVGLVTRTYPAALGASAPLIKTSYTEPSFKAAAEYEMKPDVLVYVSISRGVKSGGFTAVNTLNVQQLQPFGPETLYAYEAGFKSQLLGDTVRLNGAAFYYDYTDRQVQSGIIAPILPGVSVPIGKIVNAPRSHIYGAETELTWRPDARFELHQALSYTDGLYDEYTDLNLDTGSPIDRSGQFLGFRRWSYNGDASYRLPAAGFELTAQADYSYHDTLDPSFLGPTYRIASYWLVNATLTLSRPGAPWSVALFARNLLNERYDLTRNFFSTDVAGLKIDVAAPGRPATVGVRGSYSF